MKPSSILLLGSAAVAYQAHIVHAGNEQAGLCDWTSFLQDAGASFLQASRALVVDPAVADSSSLSVDLRNEDFEMEVTSWPRLRNSLSQFMESLNAAPKLPSHPFPSLDWSEVKFPAALICAVVLFCAGVLCSAGGIGGGGVYVTVLMVAGQLSPHDAVPLSKSVVFFGSLSSLVLNLRKSLATPADGSQAKVLIDYNICRLVIPSALFGTLLGVLLNSTFAPWLIVAMLVAILCMMTLMSCREFHKHYTTEGVESTASEQSGNSSDSDGLHEGRVEAPGQLLKPKALFEKANAEASAKSIRGRLCTGEGYCAFLLLVTVVCCGALRAHAAACRTDLVQDASNMYGRDACQRPIIKAFFGSALVKWMAPHQPQYFGSASGILLYGTVIAPALLCLGIVMSYSIFLARRENWSPKEIALYCTMAVLTGCFAGLVGIGGGLVFSPFILWMCGDPAIAVATSSTLVIFTSSSTTFQYLFTDRITMSLTIVYGIINLMASFVGTTTVHMLDTMENRKTFISGIVCLGVLASVVLSVYKLCSMGVAH